MRKCNIRYLYIHSGLDYYDTSSNYLVNRTDISCDDRIQFLVNKTSMRGYTEVYVLMSSNMERVIGSA